MADVNSPVRIGSRVCKNRITMAPTVKFYAGDDGLVTDEYVTHYEERAKAGCGLIVVEATCIAPEARLHPAQLGLWNDEQIAGHAKIAEAAHRHSALIIPQIHHGGLGTHPLCGPMTSPTKTMWGNGFKKTEALELTKDDIKRVIEQFISAAVRARKAGYDGVQLHACHAYLINDFASLVNRRTDEYGGSNENMARLGCEVIKGIRDACGSDFIISARVSGADPTPEDSSEIAKHYVKAGCDYLQVSCGIGEINSFPHDESLPYNRIAALGVRMKQAMNGIVPVSAVNGFRNVEIVSYMLENDLVDTVDLGCGLLADPAFVQAILTGSEYVKCFNCRGCAFGPDHPRTCPAMLKRGADEFPVARAEMKNPIR